jgi:beta-lactamase class A
MFVMFQKARWLRIALALATSASLSACVSMPERPGQPPIILKPAPADVGKPRPTPPRPTPDPIPTPTPRNGAAPAQLEAQIHEAWRIFPGRTGVAVVAIDDGWAIDKRGGEYFPQQSVSKLWVALTVLDQVDSGKLKLNQMVRIGREDLTLFYQPIRERVLAQGSIEESILSLLEQSVTSSDCTANDSLLRMVGGPAVVNEFIARKGLGKIRFGPGERLLQAGIAGLTWQQSYSLGQNFQTARAKLSYDVRKASLDRYLADPVDGASPLAIGNALAKLSRGELLSASSTQIMLGMLSRTSSGPNRLKAGVPPDWRFGHKTGTGQVLGAVSTGYNDVGIMTAPDGRRYAVAVMMADTTAEVPTRMEMMQSISRAVAANHR